MSGTRMTTLVYLFIYFFFLNNYLAFIGFRMLYASKRHNFQNLGNILMKHCMKVI